MAPSGGSHTVRSEAGCRNPDLYRSQTRTAPSTGVLVACPAEDRPVAVDIAVRLGTQGRRKSVPRRAGAKAGIPAGGGRRIFGVGSCGNHEPW